MNKRNYWNQSRAPFYGFVFTLPLFFIYELGILLISRDDLPALRNGADVLMRQILSLLGERGIYGFGILFMLGFVVTFLFQKRRWTVTNVRSTYLLYMLAESLGWGFGLFILLRAGQVLLLIPNGQDLVQQLILAVGAGVYEEFVFRVILISGLATLLGLALQWSPLSRRIGGGVGAAVLFSMFHFVGEFGDPFTLRLFLVRLVAGLALGMIYILRGFGIAAWSHTVYDLVVLTLITTGS